MLPLGDADRRPLAFPTVTLLIIAINAVVFVVELIGGDAFANRWSLVPADIASGRNLITILTAMFMHAGWLHICGNMLFLWVFGPEIEDVMGAVRYLVFYLLGGWLLRWRRLPLTHPPQSPTSAPAARSRLSWVLSW